MTTRAALMSRGAVSHGKMSTVGPISIGRTSNTCELRHYYEAQLCVQAAVLPNTASQPAHPSVYGFTGATSACSACVAPVTATGL